MLVFELEKDKNKKEEKKTKGKKHKSSTLNSGGGLFWRINDGRISRRVFWSFIFLPYSKRKTKNGQPQKPQVAAAWETSRRRLGPRSY